MISIEEIKTKIGWKDDQKLISDYNGFDMSKTHSQDNSNIDKHNLSILELFVNQEEAKEIMEYLDCWKGTMTWDEDCNLLAGKNSHDIIFWILTGGRFDWDKKFIDRIEKQMSEEMNNYFKNESDDVARIITRQQRFEVLKRQKWRCNQCGESLRFNSNSDWEGKIAHIDHIHPYTKRDSYSNGEENINELSNLQALCPDCNLKKGKKELH